MAEEIYTPGHTPNATAFMAKRTLESHGQFFVPWLEGAGLEVLDLGCGPGTISMGLAEAVPEGRVTGIDFGECQIAAAREKARDAGLTNLEFEVASCYELPFADGSYDRVFCHALMEHLERPHEALAEAFRVLRSGGVIGICSPDADGWLLAPPSAALTDAVEAYADLQASNGGDLRIGKRLGVLLEDAGFVRVHVSARYECYPSLEFIGNYLALQLEQNGMARHAKTVRDWSGSSHGMFAQAWVAATGEKTDHSAAVLT